MPANQKSKYGPIQDRMQHNKTKFNRKRTLIKKCMELSKLCGQKILLAQYDERLGKLHKYCSHDDFDVSHANAILESIKHKEENGQFYGEHPFQNTVVFSYTNKDFHKFCDADKDEAVPVPDLPREEAKQPQIALNIGAPDISLHVISDKKRTLKEMTKEIEAKNKV